MAESNGKDGGGALLLPGGRGGDAELTPEAARLRRTFEAADAEFDRWRYFWEHYRMMAALDRRLPKRSYESMVGK